VKAKAFDWRRPLAWFLAAVVALELISYTTFLLNSNVEVASFDLYWALIPAMTVVAALLILLARPNNGIGWLLMIWAVGIGVEAFVSVPLAGLQEPPDRMSVGVYLLLLLQNFGWVFLIFPIFHLLQVFPTGRVISPRWRWLMRLEFLMAGTLLVLAAFAEELGPLVEDENPWVLDNPIGLMPQSFVDSSWFGIPWTAGLLALTLGGLASLIVRYRRAESEERGQIKWLLYAVALFTAIYLGMALFSQGWNVPLFMDILFALSIALMPLAIAVAVLRYRLFDIDVVISRTLVYGALALFIGGVYVAIVVGVGSVLGGGDDTVLSVVATSVVAIGFQGVRRWLQGMVNRLVFGRRASPYQVLSDFARRLSATDEGLIDQVSRSLADGTSAESAAVWVRSGDRFEQRSVWPGVGGSLVSVPVGVDEIPGVDRTAWVTHDGERLGALTLTFPRGQQPTPLDERLLAELASGMGLALRNAVLTQSLRDRIEELRESRRRIVAVQDQTRRQLERDLHDGAQQQLVALKVKLALARRLAGNGAAPRTAEVLEGLNAEAEAAIQSMRDLARGIYPPLLESEGLAAAVLAHARKCPIPVSVDTGGVGRFPQPVETTVYFCIVEALQNTVKHARASSAHVALREADGEVTFTVTDDGTGFDPTGPRGHGLTNISDRLDANGGHLQLDTTPGHGTTITGTIPNRETITV
jgi:signal transduction histidine kinase